MHILVVLYAPDNIPPFYLSAQRNVGSVAGYIGKGSGWGSSKE